MKTITYSVNPIRKITLTFVFIALLTATGSAISDPVPPEKESGIKRERLGMLDLSEEIKDLDSSRYLFLSFLVTIEPGGVSTLHDHVNRPEHTYIISGTLTDYPKDGDAKEYGPGSNLVVPSDTVHWFANRGKEPVVLIATFPYKSAR